MNYSRTSPHAFCALGDGSRQLQAMGDGSHHLRAACSGPNLPCTAVLYALEGVIGDSQVSVLTCAAVLYPLEGICLGPVRIPGTYSCLFLIKSLRCKPICLGGERRKTGAGDTVTSSALQAVQVPRGPNRQEISHAMPATSGPAGKRCQRTHIAQSQRRAKSVYAQGSGPPQR